MATKAIELKVNYNDEVNDGSTGTFIVQPLERGYGTTLGNAMRRVLLTSIPVRQSHTLKLMVYSTNSLL